MLNTFQQPFQDINRSGGGHSLEESWCNLKNTTMNQNSYIKVLKKIALILFPNTSDPSKKPHESQLLLWKTEQV